MAPKRKKKIRNAKIPDGLSELIDEAIARCFSNNEEIKKVRITASNIDGVDYQFPLQGIVSFPRQDPEIFAAKIKENVPENQILAILVTFGKVKIPKSATFWL